MWQMFLPTKCLSALFQLSLKSGTSLFSEHVLSLNSRSTKYFVLLSFNEGFPYPLRKSWLLMFFSRCFMNWLLFLELCGGSQVGAVARVWTILFINCLWKGLVVLAFCGRHNDRWSHQIKYILLKYFHISFFWQHVVTFNPGQRKWAGGY